MSEYMVRVYDAAENNYSELYPNHFDNREDAIEYAIGLTKGFIDAGYDYLEADVFVKTLGLNEYALIGYVSYDCETWDKNNIEFVECFG